jgi:hypothetical protein
MMDERGAWTGHLTKPYRHTPARAAQLQRKLSTRPEELTVPETVATGRSNSYEWTRPNQLDA